jgi:hypothetical protein
MKYFNYGLPQSKDKEIYALYQPVLDCFLCVIPDLTIAKQLVVVISARYMLIICDIKQAENFSHNLIDNQVCEQWTMADKLSLIDLDRCLPVTSVKHLTCHNKSTLQWDVVKEKQWLLFCLHWLNFIDYLKKLDVSLEVDRIFNNFFNMPLYAQGDEIWKFEQTVNHFLYMGQDLSTVETELAELIETQPRLCWYYKKYVEDVK